MPTLKFLAFAGWLAGSLAACSSGPPKLMLPDGLHRVPVNSIPPVPNAQIPEVPVPAVLVSPDLPVSSGAGVRS
jgi:hypothetical protein